MFKEQYLFVILVFIYAVADGIMNNNQPIVEYYKFDDIQYVFFSQRVTWEEANMLCITIDAKLAVLNNKIKATNVAQAMAESDIAMEDAWLGARRFYSTWYWTDGNNASFRYAIPIEPDIDDFPPWSRKPSRATKECLAIDRKSHSLPNFVDLDCRILRPFICEKRSDHFMKNPIPSKWVKIKKNVYTLYHGRVTWTEAVTYCRSQGMRLAVIHNQNVVSLLSHSMTKSRPDFENVWIGARYSYGRWMWLSTGSILSSETDDTGYPPWRFGKPQKNSGCLLLDRHLENKPSFIEMLCDGKRDFVCEKYPEGELEDWMNEPVKLDYETTSIVIYPVEKTWDESKLYCQERGSILTYVNNFPLANSIVTAMGDHPREITHLWLGGLYNLNISEWRWIYNNEVIPMDKNDAGFPPWAHSVIDADTFPEESACLNLDRVDHTEPHFYGLNCESKQAFACTINCEIPPPIANGSWDCTVHNDTSKSCALQCDKGFFTVGVKNVHCAAQIGWFNKPNWLEFPLCLDPKNYIRRLTRSLSQDVQKVSGYYALLSHSNEKFNDLALQLTSKLLTLFPLSTQRKMGMTCYSKNIRRSVPFNQNDTCTALQLLLTNDKSELRKQVNVLTASNHTEWSSDIKTSGSKALIIAVIDSSTAKQNQEIFDTLRVYGHRIVIIGMNDDWEVLMPLASIGLDQRLSIYLFTEEEFEAAVKDLNRMKDRYSKCPERIPTTTRQTVSKESTKLTKEHPKVVKTISTTRKITPLQSAQIKQNRDDEIPTISSEQIPTTTRQTVSKESTKLTKEHPKVVKTSSTTRKIIPLQTAQIKPNKDDEITTINIIPSQVAADVETKDSEKNQSNKQTITTKEDSHENIDTDNDSNGNNSKETEAAPIEAHEITLSDNVETETQSTDTEQ